MKHALSENSIFNQKVLSEYSLLLPFDNAIVIDTFDTYYYFTAFQFRSLKFAENSVFGDCFKIIKKSLLTEKCGDTVSINYDNILFISIVCDKRHFF